MFADTVELKPCDQPHSVVKVKSELQRMKIKGYLIQ